MRRVTQVACIFFTNNKHYYSLIIFLQFLCQVGLHLPIAPETCKKVVKANLCRLVKPADLRKISPASQLPVC